MTKTGRNDPCPCGSGKKFKKCCALIAPPAAAVPAPVDDETPPTEALPATGGGRTWVPLQHQPATPRPSKFGRKKNRA